MENGWNVIHIDKWSSSCLKDCVSFWAEVSEKRDSAGEQKYPDVSSFALSLLSLTFSNASLERPFSKMNVVHSKSRNRFHVRSVEAILQMKYGLSRKNISFVNFTPSGDMLSSFNAKDVVNIATEEEEEEVEEIMSFEIE